jgi:hypothetical protein
MSKAHRETTTWVKNKAGGCRESKQYWHWYDCAHCGDHWEMYNEGVDEPKKEFWCLICRARGTHGEEEKDNTTSNH